jgi:hypothetical protein
MSPKESLDCVVELLRALPGVVVHRHWCTEADAHLVLALESLPSLAIIVQHATFSNRPVEVMFHGPPGLRDQPADIKKLRYLLQFSILDDNAPPSPLQTFGIFLARHLKALGLLTPQRADDLQRQWNAAVM